VVHAAILAGGVILFIIAIIGHVAPVDSGYSYPELYNLCASDMAKLGSVLMELLLSGTSEEVLEELERECRQIQLIIFAIYGGGLAGIILIIVGISRRKKLNF